MDQDSGSLAHSGRVEAQALVICHAEESKSVSAPEINASPSKSRPCVLDGLPPALGGCRICTTAKASSYLSKNGKSRFNSALSGRLPYSQISNASAYLI